MWRSTVESSLVGSTIVEAALVGSTVESSLVGRTVEVALVRSSVETSLVRRYIVVTALVRRQVFLVGSLVCVETSLVVETRLSSVKTFAVAEQSRVGHNGVGITFVFVLVVDGVSIVLVAAVLVFAVAVFSFAVRA